MNKEKNVMGQCIEEDDFVRLAVWFFPPPFLFLFYYLELDWALLEGVLYM